MASFFHACPHLRTAASKLVHRLAAPRPCFNFPLRSSTSTTPRISAFRQPSVAQFIRFQSSAAASRAPQASVAEAVSKTRARASSFPNTTDKSVAYWLLGSAASVFGIVIFGGLTRLTESGLSITEWRPVTGSRPPMSQDDWESEFAKYRASPEFQLLNPNMTLEEFKKIYWMEWIHRLWGRVIGVTFLVPTIYFIARRRVSASMAWKLSGICGLIGFQGFLGWWMVKSGLRDDLFAPGSHPRVSQYRLTAHLGAAFGVYVAMLLSGLSILKEHRLLADPEKAAKALETLKHPALRVFRGSVLALALLVFTTAMSGALVAGLDAGLIYNEFPYMGLGLTPPKKELFDPFYSHVPDQSDLWWRNMLENPSLVQLDHRILATTTFTAVMALFAYTRFSGAVRSTIPRDAKKGVMGMVHLVSLQVALGISTLIYMVPTWLASAHQAGALALLTGAVVLYSRISMPRRAILRQVFRSPTAPSHARTSLRSRLAAEQKP
ncbi:electron transfer protein 1, mitochondrial precursor [Westerdykella ornata]|uniref:Electron transfer protein 1, mitochondrial n=1 Tax=Westerdykella ornata TaxID=318751 RepID=A0A6A6JRD0_WESOR|nr:electron transfer protein 1, mitochondrial precursor [Westerdykella ornata]KAF2279112.1 electron transfer protein 1, mitochondrial precursor [Westerdykella ornata]